MATALSPGAMEEQSYAYGRDSLDDSADQELQMLMQNDEEQEDYYREGFKSESKQDEEQQGRVETPDQTEQSLDNERSMTPESLQDSNNDRVGTASPDPASTRTQSPQQREDSTDPALISTPSPQQREETPDSLGDIDNFDNDKETDEYYAQASEQLLLQQELQKLKDEGIIPQSDEPVFDYNIGDRVKQLNAKLAEEGATPEKRNRRVIFSDNLVEFSPSPNGDESTTPRTDGGGDDVDPNDLEVERLNLNDDETNDEIETQKQSSDSNLSAAGEPEDASPEGTRHQDLPHELDRLSHDQPRDNVSGGDVPDGQSNQMPSEQNQSQEQILLERNGKFELVNVSELSAEERMMMGLTPVQEPQKNEELQKNSNNSAATSSSYQPSPPPRKQRPSTATGPSGVRRQQLPPRRIQSAKTHRETNGSHTSEFNWDARSSGYGMSAEQKAAMRKMYRLQLQRQKEEEEERENEKKRQQEESESAFQWWVEKKRETDKQKRREERERRKKEEEDKEEDRDPESAFQAWVAKKRAQMMRDRVRARWEEKMRLAEQVPSSRASSSLAPCYDSPTPSSVNEANATDPDGTYKAWLSNKKEQAKIEQKIRRKMEEEKERAFYIRDRQECDRAYKDWLRSKNAQHREERSMKRATAIYSQKTARNSRKSRQLAKALEIAQAYRYTDYYGYRF